MAPKTDREWFKHFLYRDPEFQSYADEFEQWAKSTVGKEAYSVISLITDNPHPLKKHIEQLHGSSVGIKLIETAAQRFNLPEHVIEYGFVKRPDIRGVVDSRKPILFSEPHQQITINPDELVIKLYSNTRLEDIEGLWPIINQRQVLMNGYTPQLKSTYDPELIYAIYKQRLPDANDKSVTFEEIFRMYQDRTLPGYSGSDTQWHSSDTLARHYRRHFPKPDSL